MARLIQDAGTGVECGWFERVIVALLTPVARLAMRPQQSMEEKAAAAELKADKRRPVGRL